MYKEISTHTPLAGRDVITDSQSAEVTDFYSHAPRGARPPRSKNQANTLEISTHTPLAGRDRKGNHITKHLNNFYSHAPRGARHTKFHNTSNLKNFYSHAPRGARQKSL